MEDNGITNSWCVGFRMGSLVEWYGSFSIYVFSASRWPRVFSVTGEITYGLERIAMYLQNVDNVYDLIWTESPKNFVTYGDVYLQNEIEMSAYNFEHANVEQLFKAFENCEIECSR